METLPISKRTKKDIVYADFRLFKRRKLGNGNPFNPRLDFDLEDLKLSIEANGIKVPLTGNKIVGKEEYLITQGDRRLTCVENIFAKYWHYFTTDSKNQYDSLLERLKANPQTELTDTERDIKRVWDIFSRILLIPIQLEPQGTTNKDRLITIAASDLTAKRLNSLEECDLYLSMKYEGMTEKQISSETGRSLADIYRKLKLKDATPELVKQIKAGSITGTLAIDILTKEKNPEKVDIIIEDAGKDAVRKGKTNITKSNTTLAKKTPMDIMDDLDKLLGEDMSLYDKEKTEVFTFVRRSLKNGIDAKEIAEFFLISKPEPVIA